MKKIDVLVVGGSAAGLTAAITARRHYPDKTILLIRKEKLVPIPCGIPYIFGTVGTPHKNLIPDAPLEQNEVEILLDEVVELDPEKRRLSTRSGKQVEYDKLILATGSLPMMPPIPGFDKGNVFPVYKDVEHLSKMQETVKGAGKIAVIGGGFIGVEFSDECNKAGNVEVTIFERLPHCLQLSFDPEFCKEAEKILKERGIKIIADQKVVSIEGGVRAEELKLADRTVFVADLVVVAIGTVANVDLAKKAKLRLGPAGSIWVDRTMRTSYLLQR